MYQFEVLKFIEIEKKISYIKQMLRTVLDQMRQTYKIGINRIIKTESSGLKMDHAKISS